MNFFIVVQWFRRARDAAGRPVTPRRAVVGAPRRARRSVDDGVPTITGPTLAGAGEGEDAMKWKGPLPVSGKYLIEVGGTRGGASYKLTVTIK